MKKKIFFRKSELCLDLLNGGKVESLFLISEKHPLGREIIRSKPGNFFLSGSYFLFPWVNRIKTQEFTFQNKKYEYPGKIQDEIGHSIHGLVFDTERIIEDYIEDRDFSEITIAPKSRTPSYPDFKETFQLFRDRLCVTVEFKNLSNSIQFFSFGYHPYFDLGITIDSLRLSSNLWDLIPLNNSMLPLDYIFCGGRRYLFQNDERISNLKLDHCITGNTHGECPFVRLERIDTEEIVSISSNKSKNMIPQNFFQIYSPPDRKTIAIEPMSSSGDVFNSSVSSPTNLYPGETKIARFEIQYI